MIRVKYGEFMNDTRGLRIQRGWGRRIPPRAYPCGDQGEYLDRGRTYYYPGKDLLSYPGLDQYPYPDMDILSRSYPDILPSA